MAAEWRSTEGGFGDHTDLHARYADLVVVGQRDPEGTLESVYDLAEELVMMAGRCSRCPTPGRSRAWGSACWWRGTARAWPPARSTTRSPSWSGPRRWWYRVNPPEAGHIPAADMAAHLARHGVEAEAHHTVSKIPSDETALIGRRSIGIGDLLLSAAMDFGSDLVVMGAYGHSRLRELGLGGSTRYILQHMTQTDVARHGEYERETEFGSLKMVTGPSYSSPNQPDQERTTAYRDSSGPNSWSDAHRATIVGDWKEPSGKSWLNRMSIEPLLATKPVVNFHAFAAIAAFLIGIVQLVGPKGTTLHRVVGWGWVLLLMSVAASSFWIQGLRQFGPFSWIHGLSIFTLVMLPAAVVRARRHNVVAHKRTMIGIFLGALVVAGLFTLLPGRIMHAVVFGGM